MLGALLETLRGEDISLSVSVTLLQATLPMIDGLADTAESKAVTHFACITLFRGLCHCSSHVLWSPACAFPLIWITVSASTVPVLGSVLSCMRKLESYAAEGLPARYAQMNTLCCSEEYLTKALQAQQMLDTHSRVRTSCRRTSNCCCWRRLGRRSIRRS